MKIKKEFIPFFVILGISCLNLPILLLLNFLNSEFIEIVPTIILPIECIMVGLAIIYSELEVRKNERRNCKVCDGIIKDTEFILRDFGWKKEPVISYIVDGKKYEITAGFGINGIFGYKVGKKIKVYYKEENPEIASVNNNIFIIVGTMFVIFGIYMFFI